MKTLLAAAAALSFVSASALADDLIRVQASSPGATTFNVATHLGSVLKQRHGYDLEVATGFPGVRSQVNVANGEAEIGLYAPALAFFLNRGIAMYSNLENAQELAARLRPLIMYDGDLFLFGTYDESLETLADIEGKRVYLGPKGAALVNINGALIKEATGLVANEDYELVHVDWTGSGALFQDGSVDVTFRLCAPGCSFWTEISSGRPVKFLTYTEDMIAKAGFQKELAFPGRTMKQLNPGTFGDGQLNSEPVQVIGEFTGLVANDRMSDEVAYNIVKAFWETLDDLAIVAPVSANYKLEDATFGMINTIHPGAARYYEEMGVPLPE